MVMNTYESLITFMANLKRAIRDNESVFIGGGEFSPDELQALLNFIAKNLINEAE
jgi:hypothetical protein